MTVSSCFKKLLFLVMSVVCISPVDAKYFILDDHDMDQITASGQPAVISTGDNSAVSFTAVTNVAQDIGAGSQNSVRSLVLNNVAGENQVGTSLNVSASSQANGQSGLLTQSWGSINETTAVVVPPVTAAIPVNCNGALICKGSPAVVAIPGTIVVLSTTGDQIMNGGAGSTFTYAPVTNIVQTISNSQSNLVAVVVNNVSGLNQVGNAINIQGAGVSLAGNALTVTGSSASAGGQHNVLSQYRGTPANFSR